jgi:ADP-ribose pyrophosphatase
VAGAGKADEPRFTKGDFTETQLSSETVFQGKLLHVKRDRVRLPDGHEAGREYIVHPGAVVVIAVTDAGELVMERQYRYPMGREFFELPAGKIDPGEETLETGRRELAEETGYAAEHWRRLAVIHPSIGYSNERIEIYLAQGLTRVESKLDDEEFLEVFTLPLRTAIDWIRDGRITDTTSIAALFWADKVLLSGEWK